ncbi:MAG: malate dehydrogenase, partial [Dehalococcoidia bacterium]|nr:malate dehydrogenase [Dehalococcoidia bacterium]
GGAEIVNYLKTGSAYYAPSASIVQMIEAVLFDKKEILPCTAYLQGQYGIDGLYVGVPVKVGAGGAGQIIELSLSKEELSELKKSAEAVEELVDVMANSE